MLKTDVFAKRNQEPRTYRMADHKGWGDTIFWWRLPDEKGYGQLHGHMRRRLQPGDRVICPMSSGRNAIYKVRKKGHRYPMDPPDQFFVAVKFAGYEDDAGGSEA